MSKRFRIALSFASEKRDFVAKVAHSLATVFGEKQILYDKYHEAEFAHGNLALSLPSLYRDESDLVVVVLCPDYEKKEWCGLEWRAIYGLIKNRRGEDVMFARFEGVESKELYGLAGYVELDERSPDEAAGLILERLALQASLPKDHCTLKTNSPADWPETAPTLEWPVADHTQAQLAFTQLLSRTSPFRLLLIDGHSGTGKTHLAKQFLRNALQCPGMTCGLFDFKGGSDLDLGLSPFAEQLNVPPPHPGTGVSTQLSQIFTALKKAARPALLIFDNYDHAGEADRWVREGLLLSLVRAPWLRVVITGQKLVPTRGEPWAGISLPPIELRPPSAQEWFDYGKKHDVGADFTLELIEALHFRVKGKSSILAQICGPQT